MSDSADREIRIKAMEQHIERLEQETRAEQAKTEQRTGVDRQVEGELQTVQLHSDAPSRAGITSSGSGADGERG